MKESLILAGLAALALTSGVTSNAEATQLPVQLATGETAPAPKPTPRTVTVRRSHVVRAGRTRGLPARSRIVSLHAGGVRLTRACRPATTAAHLRAATTRGRVRARSSARSSP